jgi:peptide/nickel transport system substrate-binding protein
MMRKPSVDRRALFASGAAAALLAAAGVSAGPLPQQGGKLRLALSGASRKDSWAKGDGLFMQVARLGVVFEALTEVAADGTLRPELATAWNASTDSRSWSFDLRRDVMFHDGQVFGASDVAASLRRSIGPTATIEAEGPQRVRVTLDSPDPAFPFTLAAPAHVIRPAHALDKGIGTGLYQLMHFAPGQQLLAQRSPNHWKDGQAGWFDRIELVSIPSEAVRVQALAEYLVDAVDLTDGTPLAIFDDIAVHLDAGQAASRSIAMPGNIGTRHSMDDLRAAQRWWAA